MTGKREPVSCRWISSSSIRRVGTRAWYSGFGIVRPISAASNIAGPCPRSSGRPTSNCLERRVLHLIDRAMTLHRDQQIDEAIVVDDRGGLTMERRQPGAHGVRCIVGTLIEVLSGTSAGRTDAEWICDAVKWNLAFAADETARQTRNQFLIWNFDVQNGIDRASKCAHHFVERNGLFHRARKSIEQDAVHGVGLADALSQHGNRDLIGHQRSACHEVAGAHAEIRMPPQVVAKQIAGSDVSQPELALQLLSLSTFARSWRTEEDKIHVRIVLSEAYTEP
jgi:hypothetical protein